MDNEKEKDTGDNKSPAKKGRQRKKHKYNAIRVQMEFYFSDANISKDRYLGQLLQNDQFVPLEEFLKFNKIKSLTDSVEHLVTALKTSTQLQLSEDCTKVRRITAIAKRDNCDKCTLYVERLPPKADHDWVRNVFATYGKVLYVSLPRYKFSKKLKEFGFVEFEDEASVEKTLKAFQTFGGVLAYETMEPDKLDSIKSYIKAKELQNETEPADMPEVVAEVDTVKSNTGSDTMEKEEEQKVEKNQKNEEKEVEKEEEKKVEKEEDDEDVGEDEDEDEGEEENDQFSEDAPPAKRRKIEDQESTLPEQSEKIEEPASSEDGDITSKDEKADDKKKKLRRRHGTSVIKKELQLDDKVYELKILSKVEWKMLRNKYLNLQREEAKKLKRIFAHRGRGHSAQYKTPTKLASSVKSMKSSPRVNFYGAMPEEEPTGTVDCEMAEETPKRPLFSFTPGLIVNIKFREPCVDVKDFRAELKQYAYVKYIDLKEGDMEAFVRVDSAASANVLVKEYSSAEHSSLILSGETEEAYWNKIERDRDDKLNKRVKPTKVRGVKKLMRKVNTHIKFEDDDE